MSELATTNKGEIKQSAPSRKKSSPKQKQAPRAISPESRERMIAEAAYYKAESRGFSGGDAERDWLEAESEIDALFLRIKNR